MVMQKEKQDLPHQIWEEDGERENERIQTRSQTFRGRKQNTEGKMKMIKHNTWTEGQRKEKDCFESFMVIW